MVMDTRSSTLEELPPLELRELRSLDLDARRARAAPAHMSSASGVVRRGDFLYVIGDDMLSLGEFRLSDPGPGTLRRVFEASCPSTRTSARARSPTSRR
jgi:hypothetical protein